MAEQEDDVQRDEKRDEIQARAQSTKATTAAIEAAVADAAEKKKGKKWNRRFKPSKRIQGAWKARGVRTDRHSILDAIRMVKGFKSAKFDESMELHVRLGVDPKKSDQQVRGTFVFPHGVGQAKRVICFAEGQMAEQAREAGAIEVGGEELAKRIQEGWLEFDVVIAHPAMMRVVGKLGKVLGPKKLMPNPKEGSVTPRIAEAVQEFKGGKAKYRVDDNSNLHIIFGKKSFTDQALEQNLLAFLNYLKGQKPQNARGIFILSAYIAATMSPSAAIEVGQFAS